MFAIILYALAWFLAIFDFDNVFIYGMKDLFNMKFSKYSYYLVFFLIGAFIDLILIIYFIFKVLI